MVPDSPSAMLTPGRKAGRALLITAQGLWCWGMVTEAFTLLLFKLCPSCQQLSPAQRPKQCP